MSSPLKPSNRGSLVWIAVLAVVVVLGIAAVLVGRSSNDDDTAPVKGQVAAVVAGKDTDAALEQFSSPEDDPSVGQTIPTVSGTTLDGEPITVGPDGKAKIIVFAAHWCPHCQREIPLLVDHLKDSPMPDDVELLTVSTGVKPDADNYPPSAWLDDAGWTAPVLADSSAGLAASTFGLSSYPYFVVVDADGKVVFRITGEISTSDFDRLVKAAQTGESPV